MKLLITAGGGGHFAPALALIQSLPKDIEVLLVIRKYAFEADKTLSLEYVTAEKLGIPYVTITTGRLQRKLSAQSLPSLFKMPLGVYQARKILKQFRPDVVMSFGGYISAPVVVAAKMSRTPLVIHEQTLGAGLANKFAAPFATRICLSWEETKPYFPIDKSVVTGNPLKKEFVEEKEKRQLFNNSLPTVLVLGGSLGSHALNRMIEESLLELVSFANVYHQTGDAKQYQDFDALMKVKEQLAPEYKERYTVTKFINPSEIAQIMRSSDLVISRSGMNTVSELLYLGKPALLIPLPHGQNNEQKKNAMFFAAQGLGEMIPQAELSAEILVQKTKAVLATIKTYQEKGHKTQSLIRTDATARILQEIIYAKETTQT